MKPGFGYLRLPIISIHEITIKDDYPDGQDPIPYQIMADGIM